MKINKRKLKFFFKERLKLLSVIFLVFLVTASAVIIYKTFTGKDKLTAIENTFAVTQSPTFILDIKTGKITDNFRVVKSVNADEQNINEYSEGDTTIAIKMVNTDGSQSDTDVLIEKQSSSSYKLTVLTDESQMTPGAYTLSATVTQGENTQEFTQDFRWGVLAINPNKTIYTPGETSQLSIAVLDDEGEMVCDAKVKLNVKNEALNVNDELSTENGKIIVNPECAIKDFTTKPDYETSYKVGDEGSYTLTLTAQTQNGTYTIVDGFDVRKSVAFDVERVTATRVYPPVQYPVSLNIKFNQDFTGTIEETVPDQFQIFPFQGDSYSSEKGVIIKEVKAENGTKTFAWEINAKKGDTKQLGYQFKSPSISPHFFLLGPLTLKQGTKTVFEEIRQWQIANDAAGDVILLWDTTNGTPPSGWTCISCAGGNAYYGVIPRAAASYSSSTYGADSHNDHTFTFSSQSEAAGGTAYGNTSGNKQVIISHAHTWTGPTIGSGSVLPPYKNLNLIYSSNPTTIPANVIAIFDTTSLPSGWTRYSALDSNYLRGYSDNSTGGSSTHTHSASVTSSSYAMDNTDTGNNSATGAGTHTHTLSDTTGTASNAPPYVNVVFAYNSSGVDVSLPDGMLALFNATPPTNWSSVSGSAPYTDKFLVGASTGIGTTGGVSSDHTHNSGSITITSATGGASAGNLGLTGSFQAAGIDHTHNVTYSIGNSASLPLYRDTIVGEYTAPAVGITISGYVKGTNESSFIGNPPCDGSTAVLALKVNGTGTATASCNSSTGYYEFTNVTVDQSQTITVYLTHASYKGNLVLVRGSGTTDITDADIYQSRVILRDDDNGSITNSEAGQWDRDNDSTNMLFTVDGSSNMSSYDNAELHIWTSDTYAPGGTVTISTTGGSLHLDDSSTVTLANANSDIYNTTIDTSAILNINTSTYVRGNLAVTGTVAYSGTPTVTTRGTGEISGAGTIGFYNLTVGDATTATTTLSQTITLGNDISVGSGSTFNINVNLSAPGNITNTGAVSYSSGSPTLTMTGTGKTFGGGSGAVTLYNLATSGTGTNTFSAAGTNTVNNNVTVGTGTTLNINSSVSIGGNLANTTTGVITYSSGTPTLTMTNNTSSTIGGGSGAITFYNLATSGTGTHTFSGSGTNTVNNNVTVGTGTTLNINSTIAITGSITNTTTGVIGYSSGTPTVTVQGTSIGGGSGAITFYHLTKSGAGTTTFSGSGTNSIAGNLSVSAGTLTQSAILTITGTGSVSTGAVFNNNANLTVNGGAFTTTTTGTINTTAGTPTFTISGTGNLGGGSGAITLYNLTTSGTGTTTFSGSGTNTINNNVSVGTGTTLNINSPVSITGSITNTTTGIIGYSSGTPTVTVSGTSIGGGSGAITFYNLIKGGAGTTTFSGSGTNTVANNLTVNAGTLTQSATLGVTGDISMSGGTLNGTASITVGGGDVTGTGIINMTGGTFTLSGTGNFGSTTDWSFSALTFNGTTTATGTSNINTSGTLTINGTRTLNAGSKTYNLSGATPLTATGTFTADSSTVNFITNANAAVPALTYYNLQIGNSGSLGAARTYTAAAGTINVGGNLTVGAPSGSYIHVFEVNTNDPSVNVTGSMTITSLGTYSASSNTAAPLTVNNNFTNNRNGGFTHNNGKIVLASTNTSTLAYAAATSFYQFSVTQAGKTVRFDNVYQTNITNNFTLTGSDCTTGRVFIDSDDGTSVFEINATGTNSLQYVDVKNSYAVAAITANDSTDGGNNSGSWTINAGTCSAGNNPPNTPTASTPSGAGQVRNPAMTSSSFSDPDGGDTHQASQWQISTGTGGTFDANIVWDTGTTTSNLTTNTVNTTNGTFSGALSGKTRLASGTTYYWRVRHQDNNDAWSNYSSETSFSTTANSAPTAPSNTAPSGSGNSINPNLTSSAFSDTNTGDIHNASQWQASTQTGASFDANIVWDSGTDTNNLTSTSVTSGNGTFQGALSGQTQLAYTTTYYFRVRHRDDDLAWSSYSTITSFSTMDEPSGVMTRLKSGLRLFGNVRLK